MRRAVLLRALAAAVALVAIAAALLRLEGASAGLDLRQVTIGPHPATVVVPRGGPAPAVVVAHGFAGSRQLMLPLVTTLGHAGYLVVAFDFPGHGRNPTPLRGGLTDDAAASATLIAALREAVAFARSHPAGDGRVALVAHSMGSDIAIRHAMSDPAIAATVALSTFAPTVEPGNPRNLLVVTGALEPAILRDEALRLAAQAAPDGEARAGVTYGAFADGTARRAVFAANVEHIGVLYATESLAEPLAWLAAAFGRDAPSAPFLDTRGPALGLLFAGVLLLAWPLASLLPRVGALPPRRPVGWRVAGLGLGAAAATPLLLRVLPTDWLPLLLADYLVVHLAVFGLLLWAGARLMLPATPAAPTRPAALLLAAVLASAYAALGLGLAVDRHATAFLPLAERLPYAAVMLAGTLPFFLGVARAGRGVGAAAWAPGFLKLCFLLSLAGAIALDLQRLFFLIIIVPVILLFFAVHGRIAAWVTTATRHWAPGAIANAAALAAGIAATFPIVAR
jgi:pimeloyl-ACP methyl ester carboxylesterase